MGRAVTVNNFKTTLAAAVAQGAVSFSVAAGQGPKVQGLDNGNWLWMTIATVNGSGEIVNHEVIKTTGRAGDVFECAPMQRAWPAGSVVMCSSPKELFADLLQAEDLPDIYSLALEEAKAYADALVAGLWDDRGNHDASGGAFPSTGGSGASGVIKKGNIWTISVGGTLAGAAVNVGDTVRALVDGPEQTAANWAISWSGSYKTRSSVSLTTGILIASAVKVGTVALGKSFLAFRTEATHPCRLRLYQTQAHLIADASRPIDVRPVGDHGVIADIVFATGALALRFTPQFVGANTEDTPSGDIPYALTNLSGGAASITVSLIRLPLE